MPYSVSVIIASGAGMPRCPACRIIYGGNEVWNSAGDSTGRILFLSMTYDCCAMYIYYDTIWLGLLREAYTRMLLIMWGKISRVIYNRSFILFIGVLDVDMYCTLFLPTHNFMTRHILHGAGYLLGLLAMELYTNETITRSHLKREIKTPIVLFFCKAYKPSSFLIFFKPIRRSFVQLTCNQLAF